MTEKLFPDDGEHQNLEIGERLGNTQPETKQNPRSDPQNTVPHKTGNSSGAVPEVFPVSHPLRVGNGEPGPTLINVVGHQIELSETDDAYIVTFPTRSSYLRAGLRPQTLLQIGQTLPDKPIRLAHRLTQEAKPSDKPLKIEEPR